MKNLELLTTQKDQIFISIAEEGLNPIEFFWSEVPSQETQNAVVSMLVYADTTFHYVFDFRNDKHYAIFSPGAEMSIEEEYLGGWEIQLEFFGNWLKRLKKEINAANLWKDIESLQMSIYFDIESEAVKRYFTASQLVNVTKALDDIRKYLKESITIPSPSFGEVMKKLDYLEKAAKRMDIRDWFFLSVGVLVQIAVQLALSSPQTRAIFEILRSALDIARQFLPHVP